MDSPSTHSPTAESLGIILNYSCIFTHLKVQSDLLPSISHFRLNAWVFTDVSRCVFIILVAF